MSKGVAKAKASQPSPLAKGASDNEVGVFGEEFCGGGGGRSESLVEFNVSFVDNKHNSSLGDAIDLIKGNHSSGGVVGGGEEEQ